MKCDGSRPESNTWLAIHVNASLDKNHEGIIQDDSDKLDMRLSYRNALSVLFAHFSGTMKRFPMYGIADSAVGRVDLLIVGSSVCLDVANQGIYLDAAAIPITRHLAQSNPYVLQSIADKVLDIDVNGAGLEQWKYVLPAFTERCRTWKHKPTCEYIKAGKVPHTTEPAADFLCSCGRGNFPAGFISGLPEWGQLSKLAVRVAISPCYVSPFGWSAAKAATRATPGAHKASNQSKTGDQPTSEDLVRAVEDCKSRFGKLSLVEGHCVACGATKSKKGGELDVCGRCHHAKYCSVECQQKDWKLWHKKICKALKVKGWKGLDEALA